MLATRPSEDCTAGWRRALSILQLEVAAERLLGSTAVVGAIIVLLSLLAAMIARLIGVRFGAQARQGWPIVLIKRHCPHRRPDHTLTANASIHG